MEQTMSAREELSLLEAIGSLQTGQTREFHSHSKSFQGIVIRTPSGFVATANCVFLCSGVCYHLQTLCLSTENMVVEFFARFFINVPGDLSPYPPTQRPFSPIQLSPPTPLGSRPPNTIPTPIPHQLNTTPTPPSSQPSSQPTPQMPAHPTPQMTRPKR